MKAISNAKSIKSTFTVYVHTCHAGTGVPVVCYVARNSQVFDASPIFSAEFADLGLLGCWGGMATGPF